MLRRRRRVLLLAVGGLVLLTVGGVLGATFVKSPAQVAAEQAPVTPSVLTAPVTRQVVGATVVLRGTVAGAQDVEVTPAPSAGGEAAAGAKPVVTAVRKQAGELVAAGNVLAEVAGRPLVALHGAEPAYRDLRPGDSGKDVTQLRQALQELGFSSAGDAAGVFGAATKRAVTAYYRSLGFSAPTTGGATGQDETALQAAEDAVTQAERRVRDAKAGGAPTAVADAEADLATARNRLAGLRTRTGPMVPLAEFVFLPSFPARVTKFGGKVGAPVEAPLVTLSSGQLEVAGRLDPADRTLVRPGAVAEIDAEVTGFHGTGKVTEVGQPQDGAKPGAQENQTQGQASGQSFVPVTITPDQPLDAGLIGQDVRLTLKFAQTAGPVLAVPSAAITSSADGRTHVVVAAADGGQRTVEVRAGKSGAGLVEVEPVAGGLAEGDRVVVGR
ncbi:Peptidoglycan-binding (PGRP) domain of peptidoglycan hydrolases-containing protein [Amycolatopsis tolypomycina]|uniref:Peptidoglycan-binding (PGRP) domain of peptidoglycan hydrolases-containing protein n=1 Tax=Amycolatopsis tolypomycina TaxID=208445 RepID=A0A1H4I590_9PSEU|nr:Peptidoglycan-binding (PGRP) domain of peptidoglycan hydrolases-containing protein [Amycolatopsis tolypomycina]